MGWDSFIYWIPFLIGGIPFAFSDDLINNRRFFKICFAGSILWFVIGSVFTFLDINGVSEKWLFVIFSIPLIYLCCFEILRWLFKRYKGEEPYITSASSVIGGRPLPGFFGKYPKTKNISAADFVFSFAQFFIPLGLLGILIWLVRP